MLHPQKIVSRCDLHNTAQYSRQRKCFFGKSCTLMRSWIESTFRLTRGGAQVLSDKNIKIKKKALNKYEVTFLDFLQE